MKKTPMISVVLPAKNEEKNIEHAINSILEQTYTDFELIIVDDWSVDDTANICKRIQAKDNRVKYFTNEGSGLVDALNTGIYYSKGCYIARMDADDICDARRFEFQVKYFKSFPDVDVIGTDMTIFGWSEMTGFCQSATSEVSFPATHLEIVKSLPSVGSFWVLSHPTVMMRTRVIKDIGGYNKNFNRTEDLDLWVRLVLGGKQLANIKTSLLQYRASETSITSLSRIERYLNTAALIGFVRDQRYINLESCNMRLSVETLGQIGKPETIFERVSDFAILLRGVERSERIQCYYQIKQCYSNHIDNFSVCLLKKAESKSSWPGEVNQDVVEDIKCVFFDHVYH